MIAETAYFKAKARGFEPGGEIQDWIEAETEVRHRIEKERPGKSSPRRCRLRWSLPPRGATVRGRLPGGSIDAGDCLHWLLPLKRKR